MEGRVRTAVAATTSADDGDAADAADAADAGSEFQKACFGATLHHFWLYDLFKIRPLIGSLLGDPGASWEILGASGRPWGGRIHGKKQFIWHKRGQEQRSRRDNTTVLHDIASRIFLIKSESSDYSKIIEICANIR